MGTPRAGETGRGTTRGCLPGARALGDGSQGGLVSKTGPQIANSAPQIRDFELEKRPVGHSGQVYRTSLFGVRAPRWARAGQTAPLPRMERRLRGCVDQHCSNTVHS